MFKRDSHLKICFDTKKVSMNNGNYFSDYITSYSVSNKESDSCTSCYLWLFLVKYLDKIFSPVAFCFWEIIVTVCILNELLSVMVVW